MKIFLSLLTNYNKNLVQCNRCNISIYCGKECQLKDWPDHKEFCDDLEEDDYNFSDQEINDLLYNQL